MANEDKATRYHRLQRRASVAGTVLTGLFFFLLFFSGGSALLRDVVTPFTGGSFAVLVVLYVVIVALLHEVLQLPLAIYQGLTLERRYQLSTQPTASWWSDHVKEWTLGVVLAVGGALLIWSLIRWLPQWWWLAAGVSFALILVGLAQLAPVVLLPIFYDCKPLDRPALTGRLIALAERARTPVLGVFEWKLSDRTRKANAALAGLGATRRILLSDTLLAEHSDDEIEVILAHELAHHVHRDIRSGIALESALIVLGFFLADQVFSTLAFSSGLTGKGDIAALPLLVLSTGAVSLLLMPLRNAFSRAHERRADRYALAMTRNADAFVTAMKRLASQNLAEEQPSRLVQVLFHSHPSTAARIAAAQEWKRTAR